MATARRASSLGHTGGREIGDAAIDVILEFAVETALEGPAAEPVEELDHRAALVEDQADGPGEARPALLLDGELIAAGRGQRVELGFAAGFRLLSTRRAASLSAPGDGGRDRASPG